MVKIWYRCELYKPRDGGSLKFIYVHSTVPFLKICNSSSISCKKILISSEIMDDKDFNNKNSPNSRNCREKKQSLKKLIEFIIIFPEEKRVVHPPPHRSIRHKNNIFNLYLILNHETAG